MIVEGATLGAHEIVPLSSLVHVRTLGELLAPARPDEPRLGDIITGGEVHLHVVDLEVVARPLHVDPTVVVEENRRVDSSEGIVYRIGPVPQFGIGCVDDEVALIRGRGRRAMDHVGAQDVGDALVSNRRGVEPASGEDQCCASSPGWRVVVAVAAESCDGRSIAFPA